jgi:aspartate aminotransferase-like enzyme
MGEKVLHHRTPEFEKILLDCWAGLKFVFGTKQPVQILAGTGSAAMEAAVVNLLSPGDQALVVVSGKFGERFCEICAHYGIKVHRLDVPWGQPVALDEFESALKAHRAVKAVFTQACETSTATVHPIQKMAQIVARDSAALFVVDAITAVGCMPLPMDEWNIDCMIAGSQKAFMIPTGLSFVALSEKAWRVQAQARLPKFYLDLGNEKAANVRGETHFSTPTSLVVGLQVVLQQMQRQGLNAVIERCQALASATREAGAALGLKTFSSAPSSSVTALNTEGVNSGDLRDWLEKERNITIMGGQDHLKGKIIRVGHMGYILNDDMKALIQALAERLDKAESVQNALNVLTNRLQSVEPLFQ